MIRRINLFGGPGIAKSTTASRIFSELKDEFIDKNINIELVREYVKDWAYEKRPISGWDQLHIFSEQLRREEILLKNGVDLIITDCPIYLNCFYSNHNNDPFYDELYLMSEIFERYYPSINFLLARGSRIYKQSGRYHSLRDALEMDVYIENHLKSNGIKYTKVDYLTKETVLKCLTN